MTTFQHPRKPKCPALVRSSKVNGQMTLLDLPVEIVLNIIAWLPRSAKEARRKSKQHSIIQSFKALRLTSKPLAGIVAPVLLDAVNISSTSSARGFLKWCTDCAAQNRDPPVRRLSIRNVGHPSLSVNPQLVPYDVCEDILSVIAPGLCELKIVFYDCFEFSDKIANSFRRARRLWALHLQINTQTPQCTSVPTTATLDAQVNLKLHNPYPFLTSLRALPSLSELDLNNCLDHCMPLGSTGQFPSLPCVQHLRIIIDNNSTSSPSHPHKFLFELCRAISDSLLILEIKGSRYEPSKLVPVLAVARRRLEALYLSDVVLVQKCRELDFPRLRTFMLDDSRYLTRGEFYSPMFEQINTLVLRRWMGTDVPLDVPVEAFPNLNRVVLTHTSHLTPDITSLVRQCQDGNIELLASAKSMNLKEIWTVDTAEARHRALQVPFGHTSEA
ncbi:hypothetical protein PTTG_12645 [Puccinia triticina 1-1 BBBD Race 1]|uniref:F-box domain-containing protein n=2 Tax=Puccinia triticina TaxID=208348 RepID=A0A180H4B4_PUCT1|nr:uncharacterized protein PtA15_2A671 [Puccinia triticina]OAV99850.1 hypothetical protein PTTG_12645 [Puccinia triticina 1-1 BBBD Race 1]WAQ82354.1 hypothetical protein PtA15_2A671 [Puccinia triticina]WAR53209.1 hypothetical protein PtB15_2B640 [Puccinia triticina]